jgi:hypothetical protein
MTIKQEIKKIAKHYGVKYRMRNLVYAGSYDLRNPLIEINKKLKTRNDIFSTLFHELGHHYCKMNDKFVVFHTDTTDKPNKHMRKHMRDMIKTANRAELYVDKWGEKEFYKWYPKLKYIQSYRTKKEKRELKNGLLCLF